MTGSIGMNVNPSVQMVSQAKGARYSQGEITQMTRSGKIECETCKNRTYQDGSDEMVSFKSPGHISPQASAATVMSHEQEHVSNAFSEANRKGGEVIQASVSLQTSTCPECGRTYVSGGETTTQIKYNEENPYAKGFKTADSAVVAGQNMNYNV